MRRILALLLAIFMVASLCATNIFAAEEAGAGTSTEATENTKPATAVSTPEDFAAMEADGNYYLTANITLTASYPGVFKGTFDGKDFTVTLSAPMFKELEGATIKNLKTAGEIKVTPYYETVAAPTEEDPNATTQKLVTSYDVAAVAGVATDSTFLNIANATAFDTTTVAEPTPTEADPAATTNVNFRYVAGIVAYAKGDLTIDGCSNSAAIAHEVNHIAGIVAQADPGKDHVVTIKNCVNTGAMTMATKKAKAAGIVANLHEADYGPVASAVIDNCVNTADILGGDQIGGVAGWVRVENSVLSNCVNEGKIVSTQNYAGGVFGRVGDNNGSTEMVMIYNCENKGDVQAQQSQAGGIVGYAASAVYFENCSNSGKMSVRDGSTAKMHAGGIVGNINAPVYFRYCVNSGEIVANGDNYAGGIAGGCLMTSSVLFCTNTGTVTGSKQAGGIIGYVGAKSLRGAYNIMFCQSFGDVTGGNQVGGLVGYAYGSGQDEYPVVMYNVVDCNIKSTASGNTSGLFGYFNCSVAVLKHNLIAGSIEAGGTKVQAVCWNNASVSNNIGQNAVIENYTANLMVQNGEVTTLVGYKAEELVAKANELAGGEYFVKTETGYAVNVFAPAATEAVAVKTAEEFAAMVPGGNYYLDADITLTATYPIFAGTLDGKGHTVTVSAPIFRELRNATVSNLVIAGAVATATTASNSEADVAAPLALSAIDSTITGVTNKASVYGVTVAGGLVARVFGIVNIIDCANEGAISGSNKIGGIVGFGYETLLTVKNTSNSGSIDCSALATSNVAVGGIAGRIQGSRVVFEECVNACEITATKGGARVGGILGYQPSSFGRCDIINCINTANITGCDQVGGLVGWAMSFVLVDGAYNSGDVTSMQNYAGGIVGRPDTNNGTTNYTMFFENCVNDGKVQGHRQYAGGIIGYTSNNAVFENCYNNGYITGSYAAMITACDACTTAASGHHIFAGGIAGSLGGGGSFTNCVNTGKIVGTRKAAGIVAHMNSTASKAVRTITGCFNFGDVYNTCAWQENATSAAAGLVAYANNEAPVAFKNCGVMGEIKSETTTASAFAGHIENAATTFDNCFFGGTLSALASETVSGTYLLQYNAAAADLNPANIKNIYVLDSFNYAFYYFGGDVAAPEGAVNKVADFKSADFVAVLNANAGAEVFFLNAEYDKAPVEHAHNIFSKGDKAPTCVEDGFNAVISCDICYAILKAGETLPALGHNFPGVATCDNPQYCTVCNEMDFVPHTPGAEPTCTEAQVCTVCNSKLKDALGHVEVQSTDTTCEYVKDCSRCGEKNIKFHYASNKKGTAATCTKDGKTDGATCMWCGYVIKAQEVIPATGHTAQDVAAVEATCTKAGTTAGKKCATCKTVLEGCEAVPALGHTEADVEAVAPTCTEAGLTEGKKCSVCDEVLVAQEEVAALGHTEEVLAAVAPTTSATGLTEGKKCSVCDEVLVAQEEVAKLPEETTKAPETEAPAGGCGGTIGATVALVAVALLAPAGIMLKKKED